MRFSLGLLCIALVACVSVAASAVIWLGKNVFATYAVRDAEIHAARIVELTHKWETIIFRDWENCVEKLNTISPEDFSDGSVRKVTEQTRFRFPDRVDTVASSSSAISLGEKFSLSRENGFYVLQRQTKSHGIQRIIFDETRLFASVGKHVTQALPRQEKASLRLVPVAEERGFGIVRGLPGAKLEFTLEPRKHADSVAAKHAVWLAGACIFAMFAAIGLLAIRVFSLSEKRYLFASSVSHELKTPIAELRTCAETALARSRENVARSDLEAIKLSARELDVIVENLLVFSRMKNGKLRFSLAEFSVEDVFSRIFERISERLLAGGADTIFDIAPNARERRLRTSVEMLGRILFNLADNAVKYACCGDGENSVTFRVHATQTRLIIDVEDDGPGISEKYYSQIFKPFERGKAHGDTRGLGLGLPISAQSAKMLGGKLFLLKSDSSGTTFRLELPLLN